MCFSEELQENGTNVFQDVPTILANGFYDGQDEESELVSYCTLQSHIKAFQKINFQWRCGQVLTSTAADLRLFPAFGD